MLTIRTPLGEELLDLSEFEERVRSGEVPPGTFVNFPPVTGESWVRAGELEVYRGLYDPARIHFTRYFSLSRFPLVTAGVIVINLAVFLAMVLVYRSSGGAFSVVAMIDSGAKASPLIHDLGQSWRLLTANFIHRDVLHLAFNLFVLFSVGGALENAFRPIQYVAILLAAALSTTVLSLLASDSVSAGSSGLVFGCLAGLVVFGLKYREIIPVRYKGFFGAAVAPYVLVFLWMGWMSVGIDNWGHLGGLLGGAIATAFMRPRLLSVQSPAPWRGWTLAGASVLVIAVTVLGGSLWGRIPHREVLHRDEVSGVALAHPKGWRRMVTHLGELGLGNGLPEPVWLMARYELVGTPANAGLVADRWLAVQLHDGEQLGRIRSGRWRAVGPAYLDGVLGLKYEAMFEVNSHFEPSTEYRLHLYVAVKGEIAYTVAVAGPRRAFQAYEGMLEDLVSGVRLEEPRFLRQAKARVLLRPGDGVALERLEQAMRLAGEKTEELSGSAR